MKTKSELTVGWTTYEAMKFACERWHYSRCVPVGKTIKIGAWEDNKFIGVVVFSRGANKSIGSPYGLKQDSCCELTRVALGNHEHFVSKILGQALKFLKQKSPNIKIVISYADIERNHHGGIYQATNWIYEGITEPARYFIVKGKKTHPKSLHSAYKHRYSDFKQSLSWIKKYIDENATEYLDQGKHKYIFVFDKKLRKKINLRGKQYPKRTD